MFAHNSGQWCRKCRGRFYYFGPWRDDPEGISALERFNKEWPYLKEGREPPPVDIGDGLTVKKLCDCFIAAKSEKLESGELAERTFADYFKGCQLLVDFFGRDRRVDDLRPDDFARFRKELAARYSLTTLGNVVNRTKICFRYAYDQRLIREPAHFGQGFARPAARAMRKIRNEAGPKLFSREQILRIVDASDVVMRAQVLLGVNAGLGNSDLSNLPFSALDLETDWADYPRPKTEIPRRIPLWGETVSALREAIAMRPKPMDEADAGLVFLTPQGRKWIRATRHPDRDVAVFNDTLSRKFKRLLNKLEINGRKGLGLYTLRHVFQTIGGEAKDPDAVQSIMGHADDSMSAFYREAISDERLRAVVNVVRDWLFAESPEEKTEAGAK